MTVKIYKLDASPPSRAVMMLSSILDIPFELIDVHLAVKENFSPAHLKRNPLHTIPVLEDDDITIIDSHAMLIYLVEKYGKDESLYPKDLKKRTLVNEKLFFDTGILFPRLKSFVFPILYEGAKSLTEKHLRDIDEAYGFIEEFLTRSKYIAGDSITIADLSVITNVTSIAYVVPIDSNKFPKTVAWVKELEAKPYCQKYNAPGTANLGERMTVKVYKNDASPPSRAVMMMCDILNIPFELIDVNVPAREHLSPAFLKKNPLHTIPVLEDDDITITDSHAILTYLVEKYGKDDSFYPKDLKKRTLVNEKLFFDTGIMFQRLKSLVIPFFYEAATSLTEKQLRDMDEAYGFLEEFLTRSKYIAGDSITIADLSVITNVTSIAYMVPIDSNKYPKTVAWVKELEAKSYCKKYNAPGTKALGEHLKKSLQ